MLIRFVGTLVGPVVVGLLGPEGPGQCCYGG